jgi:hypothetical protein
MLKLNSKFNGKFIYEFFFSYPVSSNLTRLWKVGVYSEINNRHLNSLTKEESLEQALNFVDKTFEYRYKKRYRPFEVRFYIELPEIDIQLWGRDYLKESLQNNLDAYIKGLSYVFESYKKYPEELNSFIFEEKEYKVSDLLELMSVNIFWDDEIVKVKNALDYSLEHSDNIELKTKFFFDYLSIESPNFNDKKKSKILVNILYFFKGDLGVDLSTLDKTSSEYELYIEKLFNFFFKFIHMKIHFKYFQAIIAPIYIFTIYGKEHNYDPSEVFSTKVDEKEIVMKSPEGYKNLKIAKDEDFKIIMRFPSNLENYYGIWKLAKRVTNVNLYWKTISKIKFYGTEEEQGIKREIWTKLFKEYEKYVSDKYPNFSKEYKLMDTIFAGCTMNDRRLDWYALLTSYIIEDYEVPSKFEGGRENKVIFQVSLDTITYFDVLDLNIDKNIEK